MIVLAGWLVEDQTFGWRLHVDARRLTSGQSLQIGVKVVAKHRETETAFALKRSVTDSTVTPEPTQQRNHVPLKIGDFIARQESCDRRSEQRARRQNSFNSSRDSWRPGLSNTAQRLAREHSLKRVKSIPVRW